MFMFLQYISQGPEEYAVPGQLPGPQHALPPRASDGKGLLVYLQWVSGEAGSPWPVGLTRILRYTLQDLELRSSDITYGQFAQVYRSLMYSDQKTVHEATCPPTALAPALLP